MLIAIDPGTVQSAYLELWHGKPQKFGIVSNGEMLEKLRGRTEDWRPIVDLLAIEMVASYGMPVGREVFETVLAIGRFQEAWMRRGGAVRLVYRREVKLFHCGTTKANDASIRQSLVDRYGGKDAAIGNKANQGPLYGISKDVWSALAIAVTASQTAEALAA
jgi:hypothetical protein